MLVENSVKKYFFNLCLPINECSIEKSQTKKVCKMMERRREINADQNQKKKVFIHLEIEIFSQNEK